MYRQIIFALLIIPFAAAAQTEVSGTQSGTWDASGSPYLVTGHLTVPVGETLSIQPGVEVRFQGHYQLTVNGDLQALGAEQDSILFTPENHNLGWGGIRIDSSDICALSYCRIEHGKTSGAYPDMHGGGLALLTSNAIVSNCVFADNDATGSSNGMGGAVYAINTGDGSQTLTRFTDCRFIRNHCYGEGGAIKFTSDLNTEIVRCEFIANDCGYGGGAISCYAVVDTRITDCLFAGNYTMYSSGGVLNTLGYSNSVYLIGCTLTGNTAVTGDGGAINLAFGEAFLVNCIVYDNPGMHSDDINLDWGGTAHIHYCDIDPPPGADCSNNIDADPLFVDAGNLDFNLAEDSPCIDAGTAFFLLDGEVLVDLDPGDYAGEAPDMGAFESSLSAVADLPLGGNRLERCFPNPFLGQTSIGYAIEAPALTRISVYDVQGREVTTLLDAQLAPGEGMVRWDGRDSGGREMGAGIYLVRMRSGDVVRSARVLLAR